MLVMLLVNVLLVRVLGIAIVDENGNGLVDERVLLNDIKANGEVSLPQGRLENVCCL